MKSINIHEIIVNKENMQIISADAAFYAFMGDRMYVPFEKFVIEEDKDSFIRNFGNVQVNVLLCALPGKVKSAAIILPE